MSYLEEFFFVVGLSLFTSFIMAKLLSMASACDSFAQDHKSPPSSRKIISLAKKNEKELGFDDIVESETRPFTIFEETAKVDDHKEEVGNPIENTHDIGNKVEVGASRKIEEDVEVCVGGDELADQLVDRSPNMTAFDGIEKQLFDESPQRQDREDVGIVEEGCDSGNVGDDLNKNEDDGWLDDWEGIERSDLEKRFGAAVAFVGSKAIADRVDSNVKMEFYGLHKVSIEGSCTEPQPMALKVSARAKWNAWKQLEDISREEAMEQYIALLSKTIPDWMGEGTSEVQTIGLTSD